MSYDCAFESLYAYFLFWLQIFWGCVWASDLYVVQGKKVRIRRSFFYVIMIYSFAFMFTLTIFKINTDWFAATVTYTCFMK